MREFLNPPGAVERNLACHAVNRPHKQIAEADSPGHNRQYDKIINPAAFLVHFAYDVLSESDF